ncbi:thioredoxin-like 1-2, chloroplastic [Wolffia australiana]
MAVSLREGFCISGYSALDSTLDRKKPLFGAAAHSLEFSPWKNEYSLKQMVLGEPLAGRDKSVQNFSICFPQSARWWDKGELDNMVDIRSAGNLVDTLANAGNRLVILNFYSPDCGGCRTLHPKICQIAESNPDALFLKINYEDHRSMCYNLNIRVLPFFRFYRGQQGRICSFSCTIATINKFKDAMAKYNLGNCDSGPAKGLEKTELLKLALGESPPSSIIR